MYSWSRALNDIHLTRFSLVLTSSVLKAKACIISLPAVPKPVLSSELQDKQVKEGDNLTLDVRMPAECKAEVTWFKDDHSLKEDHHITIISAGEMHAVNIFNVTVKDEAVYRCVATNAAGSVSTDCEVLVEGTRKLFLTSSFGNGISCFREFT